MIVYQQGLCGTLNNALSTQGECVMAELPKGYGQLAFWQNGFGVRDTLEGASPDTDEHWCNTELAGSICCWNFGIGNVQQKISSMNLFVWIVCTPALSHDQWGVAIPLPNTQVRSSSSAVA